MRLAHELAQNNVVVVYFALMLPEQVLANRDLLSYFDSVNFLCLTCPPDALRSRLVDREPGAVTTRVQVWVEFDDALVAAASRIPTATVVNAGRAVDEVEHDVRRWIDTQLRRRGAFGTGSTT